MKSGPSRPNVLFITCDQWRGDCVSAAGHPVARTPNIDALAARGVLFRRHFGQAAPCAPGRACLYTGLYQMNNRVCRNGTPLDRRHDNIALAARRAGYDPTLFGYTDTAPDPRDHAPGDPALRSYEGVLPGFSVRRFLPENQKPWLSWLAARGHDVSMGSPAIHVPPGAGERPGNLPPVYGREETETAFIAEEFIRWLGEQDGADSWFAHLSFIRPHPPFVVPPPFNDMYAPGDGPAFRRGAGAAAEAAMHPFLSWMQEENLLEKFLPGLRGLVRDLDDAGFEAIRAVYYGMVAEMDDQLGRIWRALRAAKAWDDTVIVLTSDHAEMLGDHFLLGKGGFFDQSYHVPLIISDPHRPAAHGTIVDAFTEAVDLFPTLNELIGEASPPQLDGVSLRPFVQGERPSRWRDAVHWEFDFRSVADGRVEARFGLASHECNLAVLRTDDLKYVHFGGGLPPLLFDLASDPGETRNVASDPEWIGARLECAERLLRWRAAHLDRSLSLLELTPDGPRGLAAPAPRRP